MMMMMQILHLLKKVTPQFAVIISCSSDAYSALTETTYPSVDQSLIVIVAVITAIYFSNGVSSTLAEKNIPQSIKVFIGPKRNSNI